MTRLPIPPAFAWIPQFYPALAISYLFGRNILDKRKWPRILEWMLGRKGVAFILGAHPYNEMATPAERNVAKALARSRELAPILDCIDGKTVRIVDLGCGSGDMLYAVAANAPHRGFDFVGFDPSPARIESARALFDTYPLANAAATFSTEWANPGPCDVATIAGVVTLLDEAGFNDLIGKAESTSPRFIVLSGRMNFCTMIMHGNISVYADRMKERGWKVVDRWDYYRATSLALPLLHPIKAMSPERYTQQRFFVFARH